VPVVELVHGEFEHRVHDGFLSVFGMVGSVAMRWCQPSLVLMSLVLMSLVLMSRVRPAG
jgi:hypothetical protein